MRVLLLDQTTDQKEVEQDIDISASTGLLRSEAHKYTRTRKLTARMVNELSIIVSSREHQAFSHLPADKQPSGQCQCKEDPKGQGTTSDQRKREPLRIHTNKTISPDREYARCRGVCLAMPF